MKLAIVSRDGVINLRKNGGVNHRLQLELIDQSIDALIKLNDAGYTVVIITHQPGLSRGLFDLDELEAIHQCILEATEETGGHIAGIFYCPHDEQDRCHCHPPDTGLLDAIEMEFDCASENTLFFYGDNNELSMANAKSYHAINCQQQTLAQAVNALLLN